MRRRSDQGAEGGPLSEVNTTPLIDVSLVLVVILMVASPLAFESSFGVHRGAPLAQPAAVEDVPERVELAITGEQRVEVNGCAVSIDQLSGALQPLLGAGARTRDVTVSCAGQVSHGTFVRVLDIAKLNGAANIAVAEK